VYKITAGLDNLFAPFKVRRARRATKVLPWLAVDIALVAASAAQLHLTEGNYDGLVHIVIRDIATRLEKALFQKRFNQVRLIPAPLCFPAHELVRLLQENTNTLWNVCRWARCSLIRT
jgi:hypothetical protein